MRANGHSAHPSRARVKICGITNAADAYAAVAAGADALGFVFYAKSPRFISAQNASTITRSLPPFVARVGLFVNESAEIIRATVEKAGLDTLQLHGEESPEFARQFHGVKIIKAFRVQNENSLAVLPEYLDSVDAFLLDAFVAGTHGGTGSVFDWHLAKEANRMGKPIILAGGLNAQNVGEAVARVNPYAVDVSSGVESEPGRKDLTKVAEFILAAHAGRISAHSIG